MKVNSRLSALWSGLEDIASLVISHCTDSSWQKVNNVHKPLKIPVNAKPKEA